MSKDKDIILDSREIDRKIRRMAYEIYESNFNEKSLVFAGINGEGVKLAEYLVSELSKISSMETTIIEINIDKENPHNSSIEVNGGNLPAKNSVVIVVDDVLNTGRTMIYSLRPFLDKKVKKIEVAVLVDRSHGKFPIKANYTGLGLSTTLNDHIKVSLNEKREVYLN